MELDLQTALRNSIKAISPIGGLGSWRPEDDLFRAGILDSLALLALIAELERTVKVRIPHSTIRPANFRSERHILALLESLRSLKGIHEPYQRQ
jgi:acyl carrier protein